MSEVLGSGVRADDETISDADVLEMRRTFYNDGAINQFEAEKLLARAMTATGESDAWASFVVEAIVDFTVNQMTPSGYVTEAQAQWLISSLAENAQVSSPIALEVLVGVLEAAIDTPDSLSEFTLIQIGEAVLEGDGVLLGGGALTPGVVGAAEAALIARVLYAAGGASNIGVSRAEAEVLFDINDATFEAPNAGAWNELFVKAIANHLMAAQGYRAPSRQEALATSEWLAAPTPGVEQTLSAMLRPRLDGLKEIYAPVSGDEHHARQLARQIRDIEGAEILEDDEGRWLAARMNRDGVLHENEKALLRFIRDEAPAICAPLEHLYAKIDDAPEAEPASAELTT